MLSATSIHICYLIWRLLLPLGTEQPALSDPLPNLQHLYDPLAEVKCQFKSFNQLDSTFVYLKLLLSGGQVDDYFMTYEIKEDSNLIATETLQSFPGQRLMDGSLLVTLKFSKMDSGSFHLSLGKRDSNRRFDFDWPLTEAATLRLIHQDGLPVFDAFISDQDTIQIQTANPQNRQAYIYYYAHDFSQAKPPMSTGQGVTSNSLEIDSTWTVPVGESLLLIQPGLYFIQTDSTSLEGVSIRVADVHFPKPVKMEALLAPMVYITTKREYNSLQNASEPKKAFDRFWLEKTRSEPRARASIKRYFQQLSSSNQFFTNYKEGWKTDQGMIYLIFGLPLKVHRFSDREEWTYQSITNTEITFTFWKIRNIFTGYHYELARERKYDDFWLSTIAAWRNGIQVKDQ